MDMLWSGWGDPAKAAPLPDSVTGLLRDLLGVKPRDTAAHALDEISVPEPLPGPALDALADAVGGAEHVRADAETRIRHTRGKSTPDLLRLRAGDAGTPRGRRPALHPRRGSRRTARLRRTRPRRRPVRRRHLRRRRPRPGAECLRRPRPAPYERHARHRPGLPDGDAPAGPARSRRGGAPGRIRLHPRALPPVLRVGDHRRVRRRPFQRPGLRRIRPLRRDGPRTHPRDP